MKDRLRILVLGSAGQLGVELQRTFVDLGEVVALDRAEVDLSVPSQVRDVVRAAKANVIINAAAYTAVDRAESETEIAMAINAHMPGVLAEEAHGTNALLVHYSTDYVFDGSKKDPWTEDDSPNPLNVYGASKLAGEKAISEVGGRYLIFRTSWVYGPHGSNFLLTMLRLARERDMLRIVNDQMGAPTTSIELARATKSIVTGLAEGQFDRADDTSGVYHMTCSGSVSWCGFAKAIFSRSRELLEGRVPVVDPIASNDYPTPAKRPRNSRLSNEKLADRFGISLPPWEAALDEVFEVLVANHTK